MDIEATIGCAFRRSRRRAVEPLARFRRGVRRGRKRDGGRQHVRRVDRGIRRHARAGAPELHRELREEDDRKGHLRRQEAGRPAPSAAARPGAAAILQDDMHVGPRQVNRRNQRERQDRCRRDADERRDHAQVGGVVDPVRQRLDGDGAAEHAHTAHRERQSQRSTQSGQHAPFDEQLPDNPPAARAKRGPDRDLAGAAQRLPQHQVGDVRARDQDDDDAGRHEREPGRIGHAAEILFVDRDHAGADVPVRRRMFPGQATGDALDLGARVRQRGAVAQPSEHAERAESRGCAARPGACDSGSQICAVLGNPDRSLITPTMVAGAPLTTMRRPRMPGSPA